MKTIEERLAEFFDEMLPQTKKVRKKTYDSIVEDACEKYQGLLDEINEAIEQEEEAEREALVDHFASVIPDYASEKMQNLKKVERDRNSVDFNVNMVVYIVPVLNRKTGTHCEEVAKRMVEIWNEKKVTGVDIGYSTYASISGGFRKGMCYITTAVCESRNLPDDCYELETLREYRDEYLMKTEAGKQLVEEYYDIAPALVMRIDMHSDSRTIYDGIYEDYLMPCISCIEDNQMEACRDRYVTMVHDLQERYLYS